VRRFRTGGGIAIALRRAIEGGNDAVDRSERSEAEPTTPSM
jgi:hypothetical protein